MRYRVGIRMVILQYSRAQYRINSCRVSIFSRKISEFKLKYQKYLCSSTTKTLSPHFELMIRSQKLSELLFLSKYVSRQNYIYILGPILVTEFCRSLVQFIRKYRCLVSDIVVSCIFVSCRILSTRFPTLALYFSCELHFTL